MANPAGLGSPGATHLDEITLRNLARGGLTEERADLADAHLEQCACCRRHFLRYAQKEMDKDEPAQANALDDYPPVLGLMGRSLGNLQHLSELTGLASTGLEQLLTELRPLAHVRLAALLAQADELASRLTGGRYDALRQRFSQLPAVSSVSAPRRPGIAIGWANSGQPDPVNPTEGEFCGDTRFELLVRSESGKRGWVTRFACSSSADLDFTWGFRLRFSPEDEWAWLTQRGFSGTQLGALRLTVGEANWPSVLDVLIASRFGEQRDPIFVRATNGPLHEPLPGTPEEVHFWVVKL